jgi:UDP-N-acetylmuramoylalanine--D-glutamate ligase
MKIAIVGYSLEGKSSYNFFAKSGDNELTIHDLNTGLKLPKGAQAVLGDNYLDNLSNYDLIVRTAGLRPQLILDKNPEVKNKITTQLNEFMKRCPSKNVAGVTGTKGKGTTSTLLARSLEQSGKKVVLGGNIGIAMLDLLPEINLETYVVLELSSFQLIDFSQKSPKVAVCLMIVPEHLNWHLDMNEYLKAKSNLFINQSSHDIAIYYSESESSKTISSAGPAKKIPYYSPPGAHLEGDEIAIEDIVICKTSEIQLIGKHNLQNVCAAVTAYWQFSQDEVALREAITSFKGLEHNLEFVKEIDGVEYYNDSFGTTPETAMAAIEAFDSQEVLILNRIATGWPKY